MSDANAELIRQLERLRDEYAKGLPRRREVDAALNALYLQIAEWLQPVVDAKHLQIVFRPGELPESPRWEPPDMELRFGRQMVRFSACRWAHAGDAMSVYVSGPADDAKLLQVGGGGVPLRWYVISDDETDLRSLTQGTLEAILIDVLGLRK